MGNPHLAISHPMLEKRHPWCNLIGSASPWCTRKDIRIGDARADGYGAKADRLKLVPHQRIFASALARSTPTKPVHWAWRLAAQFAQLIRAADIEINNMAMNGRRAGCHYREAHPIGLPRDGCNTHYSSGTEASAKLEIRQGAGESGFSRAYRFWVNYTKPVIHRFKGKLPITTFGFYGALGSNANNKGPMCSRAALGPFPNSNCAASEKHFHVPLEATIPRNWIGQHGHLVYALDYPFNLDMTFTKGFLGVWGMIDKDAYRRMRVPYMTFPSRFDHAIELLGTIDGRRATHVNLNKPYHVTGIKPHIEWLDLHDARATIVLRDGSIDVPGIGRIVFDRRAYLASRNLDRHPTLAAIARTWRLHRPGGVSPDAAREQTLAVAYHRARALIGETAGRIDIRSTARNVTITIHNPPITSIEAPLGTMKISAHGLSIGSITIVMPSIEDLRAKRKRITDTTVSIEGFTAQHIHIADADGALAASAREVSLGVFAWRGNGRMSLAHLFAGAWSVSAKRGDITIKGSRTEVERAHIDRPAAGLIVRIAHLAAASIGIKTPLVDLAAARARIGNLHASSAPAKTRLSIGSISLDIDAGRIGSAGFGRVNVGEGRLGTCTIRSGFFSIVRENGGLAGSVGGMLDIMLNKTHGQRLDLNVPGLEVSGSLGNVHIRGPAQFTLTPTSWDLSKLILAGHEPAPLAIAARLTGGLLVHDPSTRDSSLQSSPHRAAIITRLNLDSADFKIDDVQRVSYVSARHPGVRDGRFEHMAVRGAAISNITGNGRAWIKIPVWNYVSADFAKLRGAVGVGAISVQSNGEGPRAKITDVALDLKDTGAQAHRCRAEIPLLMVSRNTYFIGDPNGKPLKLDCRFNAWLRGGYVHFRNKERPLDRRRPYK